MHDQVHEWTDDRIEEAARKFHTAYVTAANEMQDRLESWLEDYERQAKEWDEAVAKGTKTAQERKAWLREQETDLVHQQDMITKLSMDAMLADQRAAQAINDMLPDVYAENANWGAYEVDSAIGFDTAFEMYDVDTVRQLILEDPQLYPEIEFGNAKDMDWNRKRISAAMTQSILQGESIPDIAKRLATILDVDERASFRMARTAATSAENLGRMASYRRAKGMGIDIRKRWLATLDGRTRDTHRLLDGQDKELDKPFEPDGYGAKYQIAQPGDPKALPEMIMNCRCTLVSKINVEGVTEEAGERWSKLPDDVTYEEWKRGTYHTDALGEETKASKKDRGVDDGTV